MWTNDAGDDKFGADIAAALTGSLGKRKQLEAATRHTTVSGIGELKASQYGLSGDAKWMALYQARFPGLVFEDWTDDQMGWGSALARLKGGYGDLGSLIYSSLGKIGKNSPLERATSHAVHFSTGQGPKGKPEDYSPGGKYGPPGGTGSSGPNWGDPGGAPAPGPMPLARGAYVKRRPGGLLARIGEGANDEMVIPVPSGAAGALGSGVNIEELHVHNEVDLEHVVSKMSRALFMQGVQ
jgi:hypothetical protein